MTKIEWTEATWNPIVGCSIVSPGCTNCYAMRMAARLEAMNSAAYVREVSGQRNGAPPEQTPTHYAGTTERSKAGPVWTGKVALAPDRVLTEPLRRRKPTTYFVNSMGDLFHEAVPDGWIDRVFAVMALCPQHTFQVLTKRAARMWSYVVRGDDEHGDYFERLADVAVSISGSPCAAHVESIDWPLPNVWLGVSAERQKEADDRIPHLLATPAAVRFVSAEPLLGPIRFDAIMGTLCLATGDACCKGQTQVDALRGIQFCERAGAYAYPGKTGMPKGLDWVIAGGESGPGARPMHPGWVRGIRDQCTAAGVPFFFKQWGEWLPSADDVNFSDGEDWARRHFPGRRFEQHSSGHTFVAVGKARAGRMLDGRLWDEVPQR